jgi:hypothetical protein
LKIHLLFPLRQKENFNEPPTGISLVVKRWLYSGCLSVSFLERSDAGRRIAE